MRFTSLETLLSQDRIANLIKYSHYATRLEGAIAEFGVWRGGSLELLAKLNPDKDIFGIDSFEGLPVPTAGKDFHNEGDFADVNYLPVVGYFKMLYPQVRMLKGFSPNVFKYFDENILFKLVHIDVDLYQSVLDGLTFFVPRMVAGGVIILDDYKVRSTPGCEIAINEYFSNPYHEVTHREELKYFLTESSDSNNQYLIIK